jgi:hypothetical protein
MSKSLNELPTSVVWTAVSSLNFVSGPFVNSTMAVTGLRWTFTYNATAGAGEWWGTFVTNGN